MQKQSQRGKLSLDQALLRAFPLFALPFAAMFLAAASPGWLGGRNDDICDPLGPHARPRLEQEITHLVRDSIVLPGIAHIQDQQRGRQMPGTQSYVQVRIEEDRTRQAIATIDATFQLEERARPMQLVRPNPFYGRGSEVEMLPPALQIDNLGETGARPARGEGTVCAYQLTLPGFERTSMLYFREMSHLSNAWRLDSGQSFRVRRIELVL